MTQRTMNLIYVVALILVIGGGVVLLFDNIYYLVTGVDLTPDESAVLNAEDKPDIPRITTDELKSLIDSGESFLLIDVRTQDEYIKGHISGAVNIPLADIDKQIGKLSLAKDREIVTVCDNEGCNRSDQATSKLIGLGFTDVRSYSAGIHEWELSGNQLVTTTLNEDAFIDLFKDYDTTEVSAREAWSIIHEQNPIVIDVQERNNYTQEHLEGAISLDLGSSSPRSADGTFPKDRFILIYSEEGIRSKIAVEAFKKNGYTNIASMKGGIAAWKEVGNETTQN